MTVQTIRRRTATLHAVDLHVARRLRTGRRAAGLTQQDVGDVVGLTFQQVQKYEQGQNRISASTLYRIAEFLDLPVGYFFEGLGDVEPRPPSDAPGKLAAEDWRNVADVIQAASGDQDRAAALELIKQNSVRRRLAEIVAELAADA